MCARAELPLAAARGCLLVAGRYTPNSAGIAKRAPGIFALVGCISPSASLSCCSFVPSPVQRATATRTVHSTLARGGALPRKQCTPPPVTPTAFASLSHDKPSPTSLGCLFGSGSTLAPELMQASTVWGGSIPLALLHEVSILSRCR